MEEQKNKAKRGVKPAAQTQEKGLHSFLYRNCTTFPIIPLRYLTIQLLHAIIICEYSQI